MNQQGLGPAPLGLPTGPPPRVAAPQSDTRTRGGAQRTRRTAARTTLWPAGVLSHGREGEECVCSEQVPAGSAPGGLVGLGGPLRSRIYHAAPSTAARTAVLSATQEASLLQAPPEGGGLSASPQRVQRVKVKTPTGYMNATCHLARPTGSPRPGEGEAAAAQHWASVAFSSSSKLPSSAASLHFPSTDTDLSPFFTRRQTWWPWIERLYMEAQESTLSTTEKW